VIVYAIDVPRTAASNAAIDRLPKGKDRLITLSPKAAERVWMWDDTAMTLEVFAKPGTYGTVAQQQFDRDFGERGDSEKWEQVIKPNTAGRFMRRFSTVKDVDEITKQLAKLDWVELDKSAVT